MTLMVVVQLSLITVSISVITSFIRAKLDAEEAKKETNELVDRLQTAQRVVEASARNALHSSPMPGKPNWCLLDHRHTKDCALINQKRNAEGVVEYSYNLSRFRSEYVPFDPDLAAIEAIEPEFVEELVGWKAEGVNTDNFHTVRSYGSDIPVAYIPDLTEYRTEPLGVPIPVHEPKLKWKKTS